ncbi:MAG: membrane integrity-associated transporter subunit PqiC [Nitrosomonadales bacterium]|nr:membrane integrity-associated transporter subunit PqiC [Nitrosomonadales bacterium]
MSPMIKLPVCIVILALAGCQSAPPVPTDRYYRLEAVRGNAAPATPVLDETLYIAPLRADGPYAERAMLYAAEDQPRALQQYHYQHWSESPAILLQQHMRASLEAMVVAPHVTDIPSGSGIGFLLNARILRLEKIGTGSTARAVVSLRLALQKRKSSAPLLERSYSAEIMTGGDSQHAYVMACEAGLRNIYAEFLGDIKTLR